MSRHERHCQFFTVSLVPSIMLNLNVKIQTSLRTIHLLALVVRADVRAVDFLRSSSHMLFSDLIFPFLLEFGRSQCSLSINKAIRNLSLHSFVFRVGNMAHVRSIDRVGKLLTAFMASRLQRTILLSCRWL